MHHCVAKIRAIIEQGRDDRRSVLQLGYNLGRLAEMTGLGRGPFWDAWKGPVETWDLPKLSQLARDLPVFPPSPTITENHPAKPAHSALSRDQVVPDLLPAPRVDDSNR